MSVRSCTDGRDGDSDGFTDCEDWECNHNPRAVSVPAGMTYDDCFVETDPGSIVCTPRRNPDGSPVCPPLCRYAGGRTCVVGPRAGQTCTTDEDCGGAASSSSIGSAKPCSSSSDHALRMSGTGTDGSDHRTSRGVANGSPGCAESVVVRRIPLALLY